MSAIKCPNCQNYLEKPETQLNECPFCGYLFNVQGDGQDDGWEDLGEIGGGSEGSANVHALIFNFNGGTFNGNTSLTLYFEEGNGEVYFLDDIDIVPVHSSENLVFQGWSDSPNGEVLENANALSYSTVYAIYGEAPTYSYEIEYDANGGYFSLTDEDGNPNMLDCYYDYIYDTTNKDYQIISVKPTRYGYTFLGWSLSSDGGGTLYQPEEIVSELSGIESDVCLEELYAAWAAASNIYTKVNGKQCIGVSFVKVNGTYKKGIKNYVKVNGSWKTN